MPDQRLQKTKYWQKRFFDTGIEPVCDLWITSLGPDSNPVLDSFLDIAHSL